MMIVSGSSLKQAPLATLELDKKLAKEMKEYAPGHVVKVVLVASIDSLSFDKPMDPGEQGYEGYVRLKVQRAEVMESARNQMAELLDEDE